jgi:hypothetical protein
LFSKRDGAGPHVGIGVRARHVLHLPHRIGVTEQIRVVSAILIGQHLGEFLRLLLLCDLSSICTLLRNCVYGRLEELGLISLSSGNCVCCNVLAICLNLSTDASWRETRLQLSLSKCLLTCIIALSLCDFVLCSGSRVGVGINVRSCRCKWVVSAI